MVWYVCYALECILWMIWIEWNENWFTLNLLIQISQVPACWAEWRLLKEIRNQVSWLCIISQSMTQLLWWHSSSLNLSTWHIYQINFLNISWHILAILQWGDIVSLESESARCIISQFWCMQTHLWSFLVTIYLFIKIFTYFPHLRAGLKVSEKGERGWIIAASAVPGIVCGKILTHLLQY